MFSHVRSKHFSLNLLFVLSWRTGCLQADMCRQCNFQFLDFYTRTFPLPFINLVKDFNILVLVVFLGSLSWQLNWLQVWKLNTGLYCKWIVMINSMMLTYWDLFFFFFFFSACIIKNFLWISWSNLSHIITNSISVHTLRLSPLRSFEQE